ncbi:putative metal-binding protein [Edaphobacter lichenicola]|uniref:Metal-binding protein n=2 Tax=Tunturiibacter TaxID=3154218 RepID=A0ACC5P2C1_9BACT|nr:putative metal-binding protein [Edaphobacter lichenicola]NYF49890.1 putative metal-binding protein [Edaphobacter lichenicola]
MFGARGAEAELQNVAELMLSMAFGSGTYLFSPLFDKADGCVNCLRVFTWRFLLDESSEGLFD